MLVLPYVPAKGDGACLSADFTLKHFALQYGEKSVSRLKSGPGELVITVNNVTESWTMFYVKGPFLCPLFLGKGIKGPLLTKFTPI